MELKELISTLETLIMSAKKLGSKKISFQIDVKEIGSNGFISWITKTYSNVTLSMPWDEPLEIEIIIG